MRAVGLGDKFLGHAERCGAILHLVDGTEAGIAKAYKTIRGELEAYGHGLGNKPEILVLNKIDAIEKSAVAKKRSSLEKASGEDVFTISGVTGTGVDDVLRALAKLIVKRRAGERRAGGTGNGVVAVRKNFYPLSPPQAGERGVQRMTWLRPPGPVAPGLRIGLLGGSFKPGA